METIGDLLSSDLSRRIEEVIQVHQADEHAVHAEIAEYVATDSIRDQYARLFKDIAEAPAEPHESIGVWVSGFFGSGKSSFAKNLGYAMKNPKVLGKAFAGLFKRQVDDSRVSDLLDLINARIPTEVILFEVAKERDTRRVTERIAELMYVVLLRELGYAEEWEVAELEIELEAEGRLGEFIALCQTLHKRDWTIVRAGAERVARASAILHHLDPATYPAADSWAHSRREPTITVGKVVERTFELARRRRPGKALVFIIDEVGQHVARSGDKIEDLRHRRGVRQGRQEPAQGPQDPGPVLGGRHLAGEARRGGRRHRLQAGRPGQAPGSLRPSGGSGPVGHPGGRDPARPGQEARRRPRPAGALSREPGDAQRRPAARALDPAHGHHRGGLRPVLSLPAALCRPVHHDHVGHPAPTRRTPALRRQQPDDHQASL